MYSNRRLRQYVQILIKEWNFRNNVRRGTHIVCPPFLKYGFVPLASASGNDGRLHQAVFALWTITVQDSI